MDGFAQNTIFLNEIKEMENIIFFIDFYTFKFVFNEYANIRSLIINSLQTSLTFNSGYKFKIKVFLK